MTNTDVQQEIIDVVLVEYDNKGNILDFGALEVQAVYISGNVRRPFEYYLDAPKDRASMDWTKQRNYPRPDYLSSSRKRLAPQLIYKGGILHAWKKKIAVAVDRSFFETLPIIEEVEKDEAEIVWLVYDPEQETSQSRYKLVRHKAVYTKFNVALDKITKTEPGNMQDFIDHLQEKLDDKLVNGNLSDAPSLLDLVENE